MRLRRYNSTNPTNTATPETEITIIAHTGNLSDGISLLGEFVEGGDAVGEAVEHGWLHAARKMEAESKFPGLLARELYKLSKNKMKEVFAYLFPRQ
jgi:hypothetical protein